MNTMNALAQEPMSYHTVRIDNTKKVCLRYGQRAGRSGKIARRMRLRSAKVFSRWTQPATGTWARLHILSELILTPGRTSFYFLNQPGQADIQTDLFFDYQNNLKAYPIWQKWLRDHQPPMLVLWGRYDPSFIVAGAEGYRKDVAGAEVHILDAGHFALDEQAGEVIRLTGAFMEKLRGQQSSD